jgi:hypothetical protein
MPSHNPLARMPVRAACPCRCLSIENIIYSMYGDLTFTFPVSEETGGATEPDQFLAGRNGRYHADHQYVGAVGLLGCRSRRAEHVQELLAQQEELSAFEGLQLVHEADERGEMADGEYHVVTLVKTPASPRCLCPTSSSTEPAIASSPWTRKWARTCKSVGRCVPDRSLHACEPGAS